MRANERLYSRISSFASGMPHALTSHDHSSPCSACVGEVRPPHPRPSCFERGTGQGTDAHPHHASHMIEGVTGCEMPSVAVPYVCGAVWGGLPRLLRLRPEGTTCSSCAACVNHYSLTYIWAGLLPLMRLRLQSQLLSLSSGASIIILSIKVSCETPTL